MEVSVEVRGGFMEASVEVRGGFMEASMEVHVDLYGAPWTGASTDLHGDLHGPPRRLQRSLHGDP